MEYRKKKPSVFFNKKQVDRIEKIKLVLVFFSASSYRINMQLIEGQVCGVFFIKRRPIDKIELE